MGFEPYSKVFGGYSQNDGTVDFYGRINFILKPEFKVLDLGAGRAAWYEDDKNLYRKSVRLMKGKVAEVIAADVDPIVAENRAADRTVLIENGTVPLSDHSVDLIIADYVLEHIDDAALFTSEVDRLLKSGGYFCARTPHKYSYVALGSRIVSNGQHSSVLGQLQPERKEVDVFPTRYKMNTLSQIAQLFPDYEDASFLYRTEPSYFFGSKPLHTLLSLSHRFMPAPLCGNLFIFLRKQPDPRVPSAVNGAAPARVREVSAA